MNRNAYILERLIGKTISNVTFSNERYEETWAMLFFTDGTKYKFESIAEHADDHWMEVEQINENIPIPDAYYLYHNECGWYSENGDRIGWTDDKTKASELSKNELNRVMWGLIDGTFDMKYMKHNFQAIQKYKEATE